MTGPIGGNGGNVFVGVSAISLPWAPGFYIYAGNGGGGGSFGTGGAAGDTTGGLGGGNTGNTNGGNSQFYNTIQGSASGFNKNYYYGSGGGGGSQTSNVGSGVTNWGGSGSKAVVMIWYS